MPIFADVNLISNTFIKNYAIDGGAIYTNGRSFIDESVFRDNFAENGVSFSDFCCFKCAIVCSYFECVDLISAHFFSDHLCLLAIGWSY